MSHKPVGICPSCGSELRKVGHKNGEPKGRYKCMNSECSNRRWYNRQGKEV